VTVSPRHDAPSRDVVPEAVAAAVQVLLCDADGNLFPSEQPAFEASAVVTNELLAELGIGGRWTGEELRRATTGMTFRRTVTALAADHGITEIDGLERWVEREKQVVTEHLVTTLHPDHAVLDPLSELARYVGLAAVSSSALTRLQRCLAATGLDRLFAPEQVFSAEDSLPTATSKPDPAIYRHACRQLGIAPQAGLAIEDSVAGVRSAVAAGCPVVGNVQFVPPAERANRIAELNDAGAVGVLRSWSELAELLLPVLAGRSSFAGEA
jgi:HAD superfamily hydrolase (TIGR01509 family)